MLLKKITDFKDFLFTDLKKTNAIAFYACVTAIVSAFVSLVATIYVLCLGYIPVKYILILFLILAAAVAAQYFILKTNFHQKDAPIPTDTADRLGEDTEVAEGSEARESETVQAEVSAFKAEDTDTITQADGDGAAVAQVVQKKKTLTPISIAVGVLAIFLALTVFISTLQVNAKIKAMNDETYYSSYVVYTLKDTVKNEGTTKFGNLFNIRYYVDEEYHKFIRTVNKKDEPIMGVNTFVNYEERDGVVAELQDDIGKQFTIGYYFSFPKLAESLLNGETDYIILNEAMTTYILEAYPDFLDSVDIVNRTNIKKDVTEATEDPIITKPFSLYICGLDTFGEVPDEGGGDVNILLFVDPVEKEVVMVSTPRDMYVTVDHNPRVKDKLTNVGRYKSFNGLMGSLEDLYGTDIDYYVKTNFTCFMNIVDTLGGIVVTPTEDFHITGIKTGVRLDMEEGVDAYLSGEMALAYVRERKQLTRGDRSRAENGQAVFMALFEKLRSEYCENNIYYYYDTLLENIKTNMPPETSLALMNMQITDRASWAFHNYTMEGSDLYTTTSTSGGEVYVMVPDEDRLEEIKEAIDNIMTDR